MDNLFTPTEVAKQIELSVPHVYNLIRAGKIKSDRLGNAYVITQDAIDEYIAKYGKGSNQGRAFEIDPKTGLRMYQVDKIREKNPQILKELEKIFADDEE